MCLGHVNSKPINGNASYHSLKQAVQVHGQGTVRAAHEESQGGEEEQKRFKRDDIKKSPWAFGSRPTAEDTIETKAGKWR